MAEEYFSDEVLEKAGTARSYIEHLYKVQSQNYKERQDRCCWEGRGLHLACRNRPPRAADALPVDRRPAVPARPPSCTGVPSWSSNCRVAT